MAAWPRLACVAAVGSVLAAAPDASAQDRVAVLGFSGPGGAQARSAVVRQLREQYEIVEVGEWQTAARRLRAGSRGERSIAVVAEELGVLAVVDGGLSRAQRRWRLVLTVRRGSDGGVVDRVTRAVRNLGAAASAGSAAAREVTALIGRVPGGGGREVARVEPTGRTARGGSEPEPGREEPVGGRGAREEPVDRDEWRGREDREPARADRGERGDRRGGRDEPDEPRGGAARRYSEIEEERPPMFGGRPAVSQRSDPEDRSGGGRGSVGAGGEPHRDVRSRARAPSKSSPWGWLDLGIELDGAQRDFSVLINQALDTSERQSARFNSSVYPEFGARLTFYPIAVFSDRWYSGFGLEGSFHHHVYLKVFNRRQNQEVTSEQYSFAAGGTFRAVLGTADRGALFRLNVGFGRYSFFLGDMYNDIVPPMVYDHVYVGLATHVPLGTRYVGLDLGGAYLGVLGIGQEATAAYNGSGQLPSSNGFAWNVGASGQVYAGLRWRIGFEMMGFVTQHQGIGRGWGIEPSTVIGSGGNGIQTTGLAVDIHWRLIPQLVYRFGWEPGQGPARPRAGPDRGDPGGDWYDSGGGRRRRREPAEDEWDDGEW